MIRAISGPQATTADFDSHAKRNIALPDGMCPCRWASCSLFQSSATTKLPKIKKRKYLAFLNVDESSGLALAGNGGHFDFWFWATFDPTRAVTEVMERNSHG